MLYDALGQEDHQLHKEIKNRHYQAGKMTIQNRRRVQTAYREHGRRRLNVQFSHGHSSCWLQY